jgi:transposase
MSTALLYHGWGIVGYQYRRTMYFEGKVLFKITQDPSSLRCPQCESRHVIRRGALHRWFTGLPIGRKKVIIELPVHRVECKSCRAVRQVKIGFADEHSRHTRAFERYVLDLSSHTTIADAATHLGVSWDVVKDIQKRSLQRRFMRPKLGLLKKIAIDEIYVGKRHKFLTIVLDLDSGAVVFVGDGKGTDALEPFWKRLKRSKAKVEAVATDMSQAYIRAVAFNLPKAILVFDHFHVIKLFNEGLTQLRRDLYREAVDLLQKEVLKGTRWLLLKNPENLDDERNERERLKEALRLNEPLACAYYMKDDLRQIWKQPNKAAARLLLEDWIRRAAGSGIRMLQKFAKTLAAHLTGILAYYDYRISTGPLEATNNKIKTMQRQAYGFRDQVFFRLKIYALHLATYALVG